MRLKFTDYWQSIEQKKFRKIDALSKSDLFAPPEVSYFEKLVDIRKKSREQLFSKYIEFNRNIEIDYHFHLSMRTTLYKMKLGISTEMHKAKLRFQREAFRFKLGHRFQPNLQDLN